jgi:hypothetical protein
MFHTDVNDQWLKRVRCQCPDVFGIVTVVELAIDNSAKLAQLNRKKHALSAVDYTAKLADRHQLYDNNCNGRQIYRAQVVLSSYRYIVHISDSVIREKE